MKVVEISHIFKKYGPKQVINDVSMNIEAGDIYGFVGENGAGKTTIIRLISGLTQPTSGTYKLFGVEYNDPAIYAKRRLVNAVVEAPSLYLNMSCYDNLLNQAQILNIEDLSEIDKVLNMVGLGYLRDDKKKVKNYSLGMRQRLGIAICLLGSPQLLILDEPMNGLDPEGFVEIRELILELNMKYGVTILISSHMLSELAKVVTKYGFISHGHLIKEISSEELEKICEKSIVICTESNEGVFDSLKELQISKYKFINPTKIQIFEKIDYNHFVSVFTKNNIKITNIYNNDENIETYYLKLIGGHHE